MKTMLTKTLLVLALAAAVLPAGAAEKKKAGPNGGLILTGLDPRAEFFVTADQKIQITFIDPAGKPVSPAAQTVTVTMGDRAKPTTLAFAQAGNTLLSTAAISKGKDLPTVVQIKPTPERKLVTARFNLDLSKCGECKLQEYACICGH